MTDKPTERLQRLIGDESRRSFMQKGATAAIGAGVVTGGTAAASAQENEALQDQWKALLFVDGFNPNGRFVFVSGVTEWVPNYGDVTDSWFSNYNTRMIRWMNSDEIVPMFVAQDADIGEYDGDLGFVPDADDDQNQPQVYEVDREWSPFGDNERLVTIQFGPVGEDTEDQLLDTDDWWQSSDDTTTGTATSTESGN